MSSISIDEAQDLVSDEMLDAAQEACEDIFRVDAWRMLGAAIQVMIEDGWTPP